MGQGVCAMIVTMEAITKTQGQRVILDQVDLNVPPNSICGIFGPNGAGKTSLLRVLTGIWRPSSGRLSLFGQPWREQALRHVGIVWDKTVFHESWLGLHMFRSYSVLYHGTPTKGEAMFSHLGLQGSEFVAIQHYSLGCGGA